MVGVDRDGLVEGEAAGVDREARETVRRDRRRYFVVGASAKVEVMVLRVVEGDELVAGLETLAHICSDDVYQVIYTSFTNIHLISTSFQHRRHLI